MKDTRDKIWQKYEEQSWNGGGMKRNTEQIPSVSAFIAIFHLLCTERWTRIEWKDTNTYTMQRDYELRM